jgi:hypothetical protein
MTDVPAEGALVKVGFDVDSTTVAGFDASSVGIEALSCTLKQTETRRHSDGHRGTLDRHYSRKRVVSQASSGQFVCNPTETELDWLLYYILGGAPAGGVTSVANSIPEFQMLVDKVTSRYIYGGCVIDRAVFSGSAGNPIQLALDIEAKTESAPSATAFPSAVPFSSENYYVLSDLVLTIISTARKFSQFELTINNNLDKTRFHNSLTRAYIPAQSRTVQLSVNFPFTSDNSDLYAATVAGGAGTLVMADGSDTYTIAFANLMCNPVGPEITGKTEIRLPLVYDSFATDSNPSIKFTKT